MKHTMNRETATMDAPPSNPVTTLARPLPQNSDFTGDWNHEDVRLPRINLVHKTSDSELINKFGIGSFCFSKEVKLSDGKKPLSVTAVRAAKDFIEKRPFGDPEPPKVFKTEAEVIANGGHTDSKHQNDGDYYMPRGHIQLIVEAPEDLDEESLALFPYEFNGKQYGMAILTASSSGYTTTAREISTLATHNAVMRKGLRCGRLTLTSESRQSARYQWLVPVLKYSKANDEAFVKFAESLM